MAEKPETGGHRKFSEGDHAGAIPDMRRRAELFAESVGAAGLGRVRLLLDDHDEWAIPKGFEPWMGPADPFTTWGRRACM